MDSIDCADCGRPATQTVRNLCRRCYHKHYQLGTHTNFPITTQPRRRGTCTRCTEPTYSRQLCRSHYEGLRRRHTAYGRWETTLIDAAPVRAHVQALRDAGFSNVRIAELAQISDKTVQAFFTGRPKRGTTATKRCTRDVATRILAITIPTTPHQLLADGHAIDNTGTVRRLQALQAIGHNLTEISRRLGRAPSNVGRILTATQCTAATARAIEHLYDQLSMTPGDDHRATLRAQRRNWAPPLAWDDDTIDDPNATPTLGTTTVDSDSDLDDRLTELERLVEFGDRPIDAIRRVGWANWNTVPVAYRRARNSTPPWCKNGHPRLDRTQPTYCEECTATRYEKKAAS